MENYGMEIFVSAIIGLIIFYFIIQGAITSGTKRMLAELQINNKLLRKQMGIDPQTREEVEFFEKEGYFTETQSYELKKKFKKSK